MLEKMKKYTNTAKFFLWNKSKKAMAMLKKIGLLKNWRLKNQKSKILAVGVFLLVLMIVFNWQKFSALAQSVVDSFSTSDKVAETWNTTVDTVNGEVKLAERSCDDGVWDCTNTTTCANTLGDGDYIIVADANETTSKQWKTTNTSCNQPECGADGAQSTDNLVVDNTVVFTDYPARQACKEKGGRLPTKEELGCIYTNRVTFGDNFGTSYYWSATEYNATYAWNVSFSDGYTTNVNKTYSSSVRCVFGW